MHVWCTKLWAKKSPENNIVLPNAEKKKKSLIKSQL